MKRFRLAASYVLKPLAQWYLKKERSFTFEDITVKVPPGVFHPGFFSSTIFLADYLSQQDIKNQTLLELGCGSGLISIYCSKKGAFVTASDFSNKAVKAAEFNAQNNDANISVLYSDLFAVIPMQTFDWIIINPPYYPRRPMTEEDLSWYCGEHFEYFKNLFGNLKAYVNPSSNVLMVLSEDCDLKIIETIARENSLHLELVDKGQTALFETQFLFLIKGN